MTYPAPIRVAAGCRIAPESIRTVRAAALTFASRYPTLPIGRLVSLCVPVAPSSLPDPTHIEGDTLWAAPSAQRWAVGRGEAVLVPSDGESAPAHLARRFDALRSTWDTDGPSSPPRAFFAFPFTGGADSPAVLWVPRVLVQRDGMVASVVLSVRGDGGPTMRVARLWADELDRMMLGGAATNRPWEPITVMRRSETPAPAEWMERVRDAAAAVAGGQLGKVVLSRRVDLEFSRPVDVPRMMRALVARYPDCTVFALPHGTGKVVAASPERLAVKLGNRVVSHALAGTARRGADPETDAVLAAELMASAKERHEHALVVDAVARSLGEICTGIEHAREPRVMPLRLLQHLWTPVAGCVRTGNHLLDVVARLHPTPAVAGWPRGKALSWLNRIGERRDGWYSGVAGWIDALGDGEASVVLRSALIENRAARLWAGAGIVGNSRPESELAETDIKFATLLELLE
ncbi:MAG: isochorismate synthase [Magnetospirillum sp.]|nr:isochorismate synthase [Magnetospirillum sp.]